MTTEIVKAKKLPQWAKRCGYTLESFVAWQESFRKQCARDNKQAERAQKKYAQLPMLKKDWRNEIRLSARARKALSRLGVWTVGEVAALSESSFALLRNCGPATVNEIRSELQRLGFDFVPE